MPDTPALSIRYWGTTGTFARLLRPEQVTRKLAEAIVALQPSGALSQLASGPLSIEQIESVLRRELQLHQRATYGGHTTCVEVQTPGELLILDAGSGLCELGYDLQRRWSAHDYVGSRRAHVLLSHSHMDHTYATPFVAPFFDPANEFTIWAPQAVLDNLDAVLRAESALNGVFFPATFGLLQGVKRLNAIEPGREFVIGDVSVNSLALNHPGGCVGYRLQSGDRTFVFATDHEQTQVPDERLVSFAVNADIFYTDAQYLQAEYEGRDGIEDQPAISRVGWGHGTVEGVIATAIAANVRELHLGHHDPRRSDASLFRIEQYAIGRARHQLQQLERASDSMVVKLAHEGLCCTP